MRCCSNDVVSCIACARVKLHVTALQRQSRAIIAPACPQEAWFQLTTMRSKSANDIEPHGLPMLMDAILDQFWPEHGHNFSAGVNLQLRPNNNREIVQIDLGIYIQPLQRMPRRPAHGGRAERAGGGGCMDHSALLRLARRCSDAVGSQTKTRFTD